MSNLRVTLLRPCMGPKYQSIVCLAEFDFFENKPLHLTSNAIYQVSVISEKREGKSHATPPNHESV
jgi:hypothetical protein